MTVKGKLILLRHGETTYNAERRMAGQADVPLTPLGEQQAKDAGAVIGVYKYNKVYSSTLSRAFNTASFALESAQTNDHLKKADGKFDIEQRAELMEANAGRFTGLTMEDPAVRAFDRKYGAALPGGESDIEFIARVEKFYKDEVLPRLERGENVLIVSHAGVMHAFDFILGLEEIGPQGLWYTKRRLPNTAALEADYEDGKMVKFGSLGNAPSAQPKGPAGSW